MVDKRRMFTAVVVAVSMTLGFYILLVVASFFVIMPSAMQSIVWVGGLLLIIFAGTFLATFRKMLGKGNP